MASGKFRKLTSSEIEALRRRNCLCDDWSRVLVADPFDYERLYGVSFLGDIRLGVLKGEVEGEGGVRRPSRIVRATLSNCTVGDGCLIEDIGGHIANYDIGDGAQIESVGVMAVEPGATFGSGIEIEAVNEGGGRGITLFEEITAQLAYMQAMHRYRPAFIENLEKLIKAEVAKAKSDRGTVGAGASIRCVPEISNVKFGPAARVLGASALENGAVLSEAAAPAIIGSGVVARDFIIAEGASVTDGAILSKVYVGQGAKIGKQYSAENSLFFANCEAFHGEACSILAGPYTVTHHKSTLLIAGMFSFYNAGSGSNQSNHMYKLGPLHQGILERGSKTGSFSYMLWPCRIGAFSVVIGKHMGNYDLADLPFSYIDADGSGKGYVVPGFNLYTVGTVRDGAKWPSRDRRKASRKRDLIIFDVFSPYTISRMIAGEKLLGRLAAETDRSVEEVSVGGALIKRLLLKSGAKYYKSAIDMALQGEVFRRAEAAVRSGDDVRKALTPSTGACSSDWWCDVSGLLIARERLEAIEKDVESGAIASISSLLARLGDAHATYDRDAFAYYSRVFKERYGKAPAELSAKELAETADNYLASRTKFVKMVLADAEKEYGAQSRIGFGMDGDEAQREADFAAVRGTFEKDKFVKSMQAEIEDLKERVAAFKNSLK